MFGLFKKKPAAADAVQPVPEKAAKLRMSRRRALNSAPGKRTPPLPPRTQDDTH